LPRSATPAAWLTPADSCSMVAAVSCSRVAFFHKRLAVLVEGTGLMRAQQEVLPLLDLDLEGDLGVAREVNRLLLLHGHRVRGFQLLAAVAHGRPARAPTRAVNSNNKAASAPPRSRTDHTFPARDLLNTSARPGST
jgi:hypothetical protein